MKSSLLDENKHVCRDWTLKNQHTRWEWYHNTFTPSTHLCDCIIEAACFLLYMYTETGFTLEFEATRRKTWPGYEARVYMCSACCYLLFILQPTKCGKMAQDVGIVESIVVSFPSSLVGFWGFHPYMCLFSSGKLSVTCIWWIEKRWEGRPRGGYMVCKVWNYSIL